MNSSWNVQVCNSECMWYSIPTPNFLFHFLFLVFCSQWVHCAFILQLLYVMLHICRIILQWKKIGENLILIIKPTRCTNFSNLFWNKTLRVSDSSSVHHQEFFTAHTAMVYVIQVCWQLAHCQQTCMTYTITVWTVKNSWWWTQELSETHKSFIPKINLRN